MIYLILLVAGVAIVTGAILLQSGAMGAFFRVMAEITTIDREPKPVLEPSAKKEAAKKRWRTIGLVFLGVLLGIMLSIAGTIVTRPNTPQVAAAVTETINPADSHKILGIPPSALQYLTDQGYTGIKMRASDKAIAFQGIKGGSWYIGDLTPKGDSWEISFSVVETIGPQK